ncbi:MAG TPA: response regulator transcription factor [Burkholderiaceae bacterium]|nr:response regulator transcription factor [Burkholderiaceae bacterium]
MAEEHYLGAQAPAIHKSALRILLADDHEMVRIAMRYALGGIADSIDWLEASDASQAQAILEREPALDLALLDINMPGSSGLDWIRAMRHAYPTLPLLVMSAVEDAQTVRGLIDLGVAGFIPKSDSSAVILQAVRLVLAGGTYAPLRLLAQAPASIAASSRPANCIPTVAGLTGRQREVLALLARGLPNKLIARELGLSESTVKVHLLAIYRVLSVRNRTEAVVAAQAFVAVESRR